jgi:hypothetical protein
MKQLALFFSILSLAFSSAANKYYVSQSGNDAASGTSINTAWFSIAKVNTFPFRPGDVILFKRGDRFYGTITVGQSGSAGNPIVFGAYGTGSKPVITGFTNLSNWINDAKGIYEYNCTTCQLDLNMVTINDTLQPVGRWPRVTAANEGYLTFQSHTGNSSITSDAIENAPSFIGAILVIKKIQYILERERVTAQTGTTISYSPLPGSVSSPVDNYGFFFQNHVNALTKTGDWCYDSSSKKIKVLHDTANIKAATLPYLVRCKYSFITFENLTFSGCDSSAFIVTVSPNNIIIQNCTIEFSGINGIICQGSVKGVTMNYDSILYSGSNAINAGGARNWVITNCVILNTGMVIGMGQSGSQNYTGIFITGSHSLVQYNRVINTGYIGIRPQQDSFQVKNNFVDHFCMILQDGGGIYTYSDSNKYGRIIRANIILNGVGDRHGMKVDLTNPYNQAVHGLYMDNNSRHTIIDSNTVAFCAYGGLEMNTGTNDLMVQHNTFYNNGVDQIDLGISDTLYANITFRNNLLFSTQPDQLTLILNLFNGASFNTMGSFDSNYYCRPLLEPKGVNTGGYSHGQNWSFPYSDGGIIFYHPTKHFYSLDKWKMLSNLDLNTTSTPLPVQDIGKIRFEFNPTKLNKTISLGNHKYKDVYNSIYSGAFDLKPYSSAILIEADQ